MKRFATLFSSPEPEHKPWIFWTWNLQIGEDEVQRQLASIIDKGFGGIALRPGRDMTPAFLSEDFCKRFETVLNAAADNNLGVRLVFDLALPCTLGMERQLWRNEACRATHMALERIDTIAGKEPYRAQIENPDGVIALAAKVDNNKLLSTNDICHLEVKGEGIDWEPSEGNWQVMIFRKKVTTTALGEYLPNVFSSECANVFAEDVLAFVRRRFAKYTNATFKGVVAEMPPVLPRAGIMPWDDTLAVKYRSRFKKDLVGMLPILFAECDDSLLKNRTHAYCFLLQSMYERFAGTLETWLRKHHLTQWMLAPERRPTIADGSLRNFCTTPEVTLTASGLQCMDGLEESAIPFHACVSANDLEHRRETVAVVGRNLQRSANSLQSLKSECDTAIGLGTNHLLMDGFYFNLDRRVSGKAGFGPFWYSADWDAMKELCSYVTAQRTVMSGLQASPEVAVLYPTNSVLADYRPGSDEAVRRVGAQLRRIARYLREQSIDFDMVSEEFLLKCQIRRSGEFGTGDRVRKGNYRALVIPHTRLISKSVLVYIEKLAVKKGLIVFVDAPPEGDLEVGVTRSISARIEKLVESRKEHVHVASVREIGSALATIEPKATAMVNGSICGDIHITHRSGESYDAYLLRNASTSQDYFVRVTVPEGKHVSIVQADRGEIHEHPDTSTSDGKTVLGLVFSPLQTHMVVVSDAQLPLPEMTPEQQRRFSITTCGNRSYRMVLKNQWIFVPISPNVLPVASWNMRIGLSRESGGFAHFYESTFFVKELPERCFLVLDGIPARVGELGGFSKALEITVNGSRLAVSKGPSFAPDDPLFALFRNHLICDLCGCVNRGPNRVVVRSTGLYSHPLSLTYPPLIAGDFAIRKDARGWVIDEPLQEISHDSWTPHGFPHLSGIGEYRHVFEVPSKYKGLVLRFSSVSGSVSVNLNDKEVCKQGWQPMEFDITDFCNQKRNELHLRVTNTVDNILRLNGRPSGLLGEAYVDVY